MVACRVALFELDERERPLLHVAGQHPLELGELPGADRSAPRRALHAPRYQKGKSEDPDEIRTFADLT